MSDQVPGDLGNPIDGAVWTGGDGKLLLTVTEAAGLLSINRCTIYDMLGRGDLASVKIGRRRLISRLALVDFITRSEQRSDAAAPSVECWARPGGRDGQHP